MTSFQIGILFFLLSLLSLGSYGRIARKRAVILVCIIMILQAGLRDIATSGDTWNYENGYYRIADMSWNDIIDSFKVFADDYHGRDPGYKIYVKITQIIGVDFREYLFIVAALISIPLCSLAYRFIPSVSGIFLAGLLYESLFASFFSTGIRQTASMGIIYASIPFLLNKKLSWVKALCCHYSMLFIAYTIHASALIYFPIAILMRYNNPRKLLVSGLLLVPLFMYLAPQITFLLGEGTIYESYLGAQDNLGTPVFSAMVVLVTIAIAVYSKLFIRCYPKSNLFLLINLFMACCLMPASWVNSNFIRIVFIFLIFIMALVPMLADCLNSEKEFFLSRGQIYTCVGSMLLLFMYLS